MRRCASLAALLAVLSLASTGAAWAAGPLVLSPGGCCEAGGYPIAGTGPGGITLRFIDDGTFEVNLLLQNATTDQTLTIENALTPEPANSFVQQTGAQFAAFTPCDAHGGDAICAFPNSTIDPFAPGSVTLAPGGMVDVQLSYQLISCAKVPVSSTATANSLDVSFSDASGAIQQESFPIGRILLLPQQPVGEECLPRPFSYVAMTGSFSTAPGHKPIPGSDGDTCTKTATGGIAFTSRMFLADAMVEFRIEIDLPRFRGVGSYPPAQAGKAGPQVVLWGGFGSGGATIFQNTSTPITVTQATGSTLSGRFDASFKGHGRSIRAYGNWRCTILRS